MSRRLRCAIYTRKSTEEGLDQQFNSLHAQREACEAYVMSQTGEGWSAIRTAYDDGGFSGGSLERPGLQALLQDIGRGLIDIVVVYKVDRLTRSLADFAKIVELFDRHAVSFVSVTQAFNTTTSMGRLTLNVLLSFAQFEREVTGERIRDKVAASKAKGLRMGGRPPLGYDIKDGRLAVNEVEAEQVRWMFARYLELGTVKRLEAAMREAKLEAKRWVTKKGHTIGGGYLTHGPLNYLLRNPVYRGVTRHKDRRYPDTHPAIVDKVLWDQVQAQLDAAKAAKPTSPIRSEPALLDGLLFDDRGHPMVVVHTTRSGQRYRYYVSRPKVTGKGEAGSIHRISAGMIEQFLVERLTTRLAANWARDAQPDQRVGDAIARVVIGKDQLLVTLKPEAGAAIDAGSIRLPFFVSRSRSGVVLDGPDRSSCSAPRLDRALIRGITLARIWAGRLERGEVANITALAAAERLCVRYTARLLPLAYLAPDLTQMILEGRQPPGLTLGHLTTRELPVAWSEQRALIG